MMTRRRATRLEKGARHCVDGDRSAARPAGSYGDERWLEVRLPDGVLLVLELREGPAEAASAGQPNTPVFFACDDLDATWQELVRRGVAFAQEPVDKPFGRWSLLEDTEGNRFPPDRNELILLHPSCGGQRGSRAVSDRSSDTAAVAISESGARRRYR